MCLALCLVPCNTRKLDVSAVCMELCVRRKERSSRKGFKSEMFDIFPNMKHLDMSCETNCCYGLIGAGVKARSLKSLRMAFGDVCEVVLSDCTGLTELDLVGAETANFQSADFYRCLAKLPNLRTLKLPKKQRFLSMRKGRLDDKSAQAMSLVGPRLQHFLCRDAFHLEDGSLELFQFDPAILTNLTLDKYTQFGPTALVVLQNLTSLQELSLKYAPLTAECVQT